MGISLFGESNTEIKLLSLVQHIAWGTVPYQLWNSELDLAFWAAFSVVLCFFAIQPQNYPHCYWQILYALLQNCSKE